MLLLLPDGKRALRLYQLKEKRPGCFFFGPATRSSPKLPAIHEFTARKKCKK
jgi:hypothetical protein